MEGHHQHGVHRTVIRQRAIITFPYAVGENHLVFTDGRFGKRRRNRIAGYVVVRPMTDKGEDPLLVGDGDRADARLLVDDLRQSHGRITGDALRKNVQRPLRNLEGLCRRDGGNPVGHVFLVADDAHEQGGADRIRQDHREGDHLNQGDRIGIGTGDEENDGHLYDLREEGGDECNPRIENIFRTVLSVQVQMNEPADGPLDRRRKTARKGGESPQEKPVEPAGEPDGRPENGPSDDPGQYRTDGPRIGNRILDGHPQIGAHDRQCGKNKVEIDAIPRADRIGGQRFEQRRFAVEVGDHHENRHRLGQTKENFHP